MGCGDRGGNGRQRGIGRAGIVAVGGKRAAKNGRDGDRWGEEGESDERRARWHRAIRDWVGRLGRAAIHSRDGEEKAKRVIRTTEKKRGQEDD